MAPWIFSCHTVLFNILIKQNAYNANNKTKAKNGSSFEMLNIIQFPIAKPAKHPPTFNDRLI